MKRFKYHALCLAIALVMVGAFFGLSLAKDALFTPPQQVAKIQPVGSTPDKPIDQTDNGTPDTPVCDLIEPCPPNLK